VIHVRITILDLALQRAPDRSFCPSEAAKVLAANWRPLMPQIRATVATMPEILATQRGEPVDPITAKGPIRLRLRP
jgi:hypothetical protein